MEERRSSQLQESLTTRYIVPPPMQRWQVAGRALAFVAPSPTLPAAPPMMQR